jgi:uncharacterized membrane protein
VDTGYDILLTLHLLCVIGGFGFLGYTGLTLVVGRRRGASVGTLEVALQVGQLAELFVYGAALFGIGAVGSSHGWKFGQTWIWLALVGYVIDIGLLHAVIKKSQREYVGLAQRLAEVGGRSKERPPEVARIESIERRISLGWGGFNVVTIAVVALMVWRPGA